MNLGIVILNWNGKNLIKKFLPSVVKHTPLIHNGSTDDSVEFIKSNFKRVKIIKLDKNHGYASGYNIGLKNIDDDILCLLNNDIEAVSYTHLTLPTIRLV